MVIGRTNDNKINIKTDGTEGLRIVECSCCQPCNSPNFKGYIANADGSYNYFKFLKIKYSYNFNETVVTPIRITVREEGYEHTIIIKLKSDCSTIISGASGTGRNFQKQTSVSSGCFTTDTKDSQIIAFTPSGQLTFHVTESSFSSCGTNFPPYEYEESGAVLSPIFYRPFPNNPPIFITDIISETEAFMIISNSPQANNKFYYYLSNAPF
jgi:hypothetical protein